MLRRTISNIHSLRKPCPLARHSTTTILPSSQTFVSYPLGTAFSGHSCAFAHPTHSLLSPHNTTAECTSTADSGADSAAIAAAAAAMPHVRVRGSSHSANTNTTNNNNNTNGKSIARHPPIRRWFDAVISLAANPLEPLNCPETQKKRGAQRGVGDGASHHHSASTTNSNNTNNPWLKAVVSPLAREARAILKTIQEHNPQGGESSSSPFFPSPSSTSSAPSTASAAYNLAASSYSSSSTASVALPDSIVSALWSVFDRLFLLRYKKGLSPAEKLCIEARQYEYFLLMADGQTDGERMRALAAQIKEETERLTTAADSSSSSSSSSSTRLLSLVEALRGASMPLYHRWLKQSAAMGHIVSDAAAFASVGLDQRGSTCKSAPPPTSKSSDANNRKVVNNSRSVDASNAAAETEERPSDDDHHHNNNNNQHRKGRRNSSIVEFDLHEQFGGKVRVGGAYGLPGAHGVQKIILLRAALIKAMGRLERRKRQGQLGDISFGGGGCVVPPSFSPSSSPSSSASSSETEAINQQKALFLAKWYEERKAAMATLDEHCFTLLKQWMRHGEGISLREMRWDDTAPSILEKVIASEVVHPFPYPSLTTIRHRMQPTARRRHLFCFFHEGIGVDEPLIAVQVALTRGVANSVDEILGREAPVAVEPARHTPQEFSAHLLASSPLVGGGEEEGKAAHAPQNDEGFDTAIFYSINSAHVGLKGVDLGNSLIKAVVKHLQATYGIASPVAVQKAVTATSSTATNGAAQNASEGANIADDDDVADADADAEGGGAADADDEEGLSTFSTLSPVPTYTHWLRAEIKKLSACTCRGAGGGDSGAVDIHSAEALDALVEALYAANSRVFGPLLTQQPSSSPTQQAQPSKKGGGVVIGGGGGGRPANTPNKAATQLPPAALFVRNAAPAAPLPKTVARKWLQQISDAVRLYESAEAEAAAAGTTSNNSTQKISSSSSGSAFTSSSNVLEAMLAMFAPPPPPLSPEELAAVIRRKKDPIGALHDAPPTIAAAANDNNNNNNSTTRNNKRPQVWWWAVPGVAGLLERPVMQSVTCYLTLEKQPSKGAAAAAAAPTSTAAPSAGGGGSPPPLILAPSRPPPALDPVANFHVSNGAVLWRVNWMANQSPKGSAESACVMVNYWYDLDTNAVNARNYELGRAVPVGAPVIALWGKGV